LGILSGYVTHDPGIANAKLC